MKSQNRVSQSDVNPLTLELYYRGLATNKERKQVEKALIADSEVRKRYDALQESERAIRRIVEQELNRLNIPKMPPAPSPRKRKVVVGLLLAAVLLCAIIPAYLYLKNSGSPKDNVIAEETIEEAAPAIIEDIPNNEIAVTEEPPITPPAIAVPSEPPITPPVKQQSGSQKPRAEPKKTEIVEKPRTEPAKPKEPELRIEPEKGTSVVTVPPPDTGARLRGGDQPKDQPAAPAASEEPSNINIPPGITFIFDNMFANRGLTFVVIPARITSIGKNAFAGNPLVSVSIGAYVSIADNAIPGNFAAVYNAGGKAAGTYTRPDVHSEDWGKR